MSTVFTNISNTTHHGIPGDEDLYGLGLRLGSYLQWLTFIVFYHLENENIVRTITAPWILELHADILYSFGSSVASAFSILRCYLQ